MSAQAILRTTCRDQMNRNDAGKKAKQSINVHADSGGYYDAHGAKRILAEVSREHGPASADALIRELELDRIFGFKTAATADGASGENSTPT